MEAIPFVQMYLCTLPTGSARIFEPPFDLVLYKIEYHNYVYILAGKELNLAISRVNIKKIERMLVE